MPDEEESTLSTSAEVDIISTNIRELLSPENLRTENRNVLTSALESLCNFVIQRKNEILLCKNEEEEYCSVLLVTLCQGLTDLIDSCEAFANTILQAQEFILSFCLDRIKTERVPTCCSQVMYVKMVDGVHHGKRAFENTELEAIAKAFETLEAPKFVKDYKSQSKSSSGQFGLIFASCLSSSEDKPTSFKQSTSSSDWPVQFRDHCSQLMQKLNAGSILIDYALQSPFLKLFTCYFDLKVSSKDQNTTTVDMKSMEKLSEELMMINNIVGMENIVGSTQEPLQKLKEIVCSCLKAALFVAIGCYEVDDHDQSESKASGNVEDSCRKYAWRATESSLAIFKTVLTSVDASPYFSTAVYQNLKAIAVDTILAGFDLALDGLDIGTSEPKTKEASKTWKWFSGLNIMLVTTASKLVTILAALDDFVSFENKPITDKEKAEISHDDLDLNAPCSASKRLGWLLKRNNIPLQLWRLFCASYSMANHIREIKEVQVEEQTQREVDQKDATDSAKTSSSDEGGEEDGSLLGQWLENILSESMKTRSDTKEAKEEGKSEVAYTQSLDIFILLGSSLLDLCVKFFPTCMKYGFGDVVKKSFDVNGIKSLADMVKEIDRTIDELGSKEDLTTNMYNYLIMLQSSDIVNGDMLELLISELGLSINDDYPLYIRPLALSLIGRLALSEQETCLRDGKGFANTQRAIVSLEKVIDKLGRESDPNENKAVEDLNVEHAQLLALLYVNLSEDKKVSLIKKSFAKLKRLVDTSTAVVPLNACRLMIIVDYMLRCFSKVPKQLFYQVSRNILSAPPRNDDGFNIEYTQSIFKEEDLFRNVAKKLDLENRQASLQQQTPRFYDLIDEEFLKRPSNSLVLQTFASNDIASETYKDFYLSFLTLSVKMLSFIEENQSNAEETLQVLAARSTVLRVWKFLTCLIPPLALLKEILQPEGVLKSAETTLFFLRIMPSIYLRVKAEPESLIKELFIFNEVVTEEVHSLMQEVVETCTKTSYISDLATNACLEECDHDSEPNWLRYVLADSLYSLLLALFERFVTSEEGAEFNREAVGKMAWSVLNSIIACHKKIKISIVSQSGNDFTALIGKLIGIRESHQVEDVNEIDFKTCLPDEIKKAADKWKSILLTQFPTSKSDALACDDPEDNDFIEFVDNLLASHLTVFVTGTSFKSPAFAMKHLLKSLVDVMLCVMTWLKSQADEQFQMIQVNVITAFVNLITDSTVDHVSETANQILEIAIDQNQSDKLQEILHSHFLSFCFFVVDEEIKQREKFITNEETVMHCIGCIEESLQRSDDLSSTAIFSNADCHLKLASLLLSIRLPKFRKVYAMKVLKMFSFVLMSSENTQRNSVRRAVIHVFNAEPSILEEWLLSEVTSDLDETSGGIGSIKVLQKFVNCIIQQQENDLEGILETFLSVYGNIICMYIASPADGKDFAYGNLFDVLINIASSIGANGHVSLLKSVMKWINISRVAVLDNLSSAISSSSPVSEALMACISALLCYIIKILTAMKKYCVMDSNSLELQLSCTESELTTKDRTDNEWDEDVNTEDEDSAGEESDDESMCNKLCTFTVTQRDFMNQHWYHCHTCKMNDGVGCCSVCAKVCHKDHDVTYAKYGSFFCDCGAKDDGSCKALTKRATVGGQTESNKKPVSPFAAWSAGELETGRMDTSLDARGSQKKSKGIEKKLSPDNWHQDSSFIHLLGSLLKESKDEIIEILRDEQCLENYVVLLREIEKYQAFATESLSGQKPGSNDVLLAIKNLLAQDKDVQASDKLMFPILGSQEGAFESVRLKLSGEQGQTIRQLINAHVIRHTAMCLMISQNGRRQHLAVTHEKGKITILQLSGLLKQPDTTSRKLTLNRLSSTTLPFTVISINSNVENEDVLAVCGLKDCHVITYGHAGSVASHLALPLQLETGNFVIKTVWVPGSQTAIALLTADFVEIFDLSRSVTSPTHHYVLPGGKVRDVTFINDGNSMRIAVMSSHGHMYTEVMNDASGAAEGPFFLTNIISVSHAALKDSNGIMAGGGVSIYYSHALQLVFFSYAQGKSFVGVLKDDFSEIERFFELSSAVASHAALCSFHEIAGQPGLLHCVNQSTGNPVVIMVEPDRIMVQDIKTTPSKSKIQDAVCYYHVFPALHNTEKTVQQKTTMIVLLEDGSLRIYNANRDETDYWLQPQFKPKSFTNARQLPKKSKPSSRQAHSTSPASSTSFPTDFFEHCQQTNDIEFGGADILHIYNSQQVKNRLNTAGMYIANTKANGFKVEVTNTNASNVMVGIRVHVGARSVEKTPTHVEIFGRIIPLRLSRYRWFDVPFTRSESLTADKKITLTFGPSADSSGISMIDSIKVYYKSKETFGWPEDVNEVQSGSPDLTHDARNLSATTDELQTVELSSSESLLAKVLETLVEHVACFKISDGSEMHKELLSFSTNLVTSKTPLNIQCQAKALMASLFSSKNDFFDRKDEAQLNRVLRQFKAATADPVVFGPLYAESVLEVLNVARSIGNARPKNLIRILKEFSDGGNILDELMSSFWKLYNLRPVNYSLAPLATRAIGSLDGTIEALVEVLFAVLLGDADNFGRIVDILISHLLSKDSSISFATKRGISQAIQSRKKITVVTDSSPTLSESPAAEDVTSQLESAQKETVHEVQQQEEISTMQDHSYVEGDTEEIEPQQNGLQVYLGGDEAVIELAIALSLQDQANENGDEEDDDADEDDVEEVDFEDDTDGPLPDELDDQQMQEESQLLGQSLSIAAEQITRSHSEESSSQLEKSNERQDAQDIEKPFMDACKQKQTFIEITDSALEASWRKLFSAFVERLSDLKNANGMQAIPYLQVLLLLCANLTDSDEDRKNLQSVVAVCLEQLEQRAESSGSTSERNAKKEVQLVIIRFFSVLMSQTKPSKDSKKVEETKASKVKLKPSKIVAKQLADEGILSYCLKTLLNLLPYWRKLKSTSTENTHTEREVLLKANPHHTIPDMSPFFLKQYVKSHSNDLFEAFPQLLTEMVLRVPYQIRKRLEELSDMEASSFGNEWMQCLCEYMIATDTPFVRRHVRKLLLVLCGSKEKYRRFKDIHTFKSHMEVIRHILGPDAAGDKQTNFCYEETVKLADNAKACMEIASIRNDNWQAFCKEEKGILSFLVQASYQLSSEHVSGILLQLIGLALGNSPPKQSGTSNGDEHAEKINDSESLKELVVMLFEQCYSTLLFNFIKFFLLESNSTSMRWKAHDLVHTVFKNVSSDQQYLLIELMWQLWQFVPSSGHKAAQYIDLLGYITVKTPSSEEKMEKYTSAALSLLSRANGLLLNHPNASVYRRLQSLVEVSGFYLENDPCIVCNNPEIPFTHTKLTFIKSDIRYTTTAQLVKLNANYTISRLLLRISDVKKAKMVKTINIYYNNKPVPSVVELKNKRNIWQHAKKISLNAEQTDVKVDFTLPIVAYNLMIEYADFYDNIQLSAESLQCPRCSANVPANPGVCGNCGENVYQCHKCRAINYDERDPYLCTSCGFCKYGKFEYTLVTRTCCAVEPVHDESERQKALNSVNSLLESADKIYVQLSTHKQSLETSLCNVSEENNSTTKVTSTTASGTSGTSATAASQVNRNIQNIAQKYCVDCKTSFEELSTIIQKVTAIRKELTAYDIQQQDTLSTIVVPSPDISPRSKKEFPTFFSPASSTASSVVSDQKAVAWPSNDEIFMGKCYGCALSTAEHCLIVLRAIATIKSSHAYMLDKGLLNELLEHNLQQRKSQVTSLAKKLIIMITQGNISATYDLNQMIMKQVNLCLESKAANIISDISLQNQMSVLGLSLNTFDHCWNQRLKCVFNLFLDSVQKNDTDIMENVTLPCLKILAGSMQQAIKLKDGQNERQPAALYSVSASEWLDGTSSYMSQYSGRKEEDKERCLAAKYLSIWMKKTQAKRSIVKSSYMNGEVWLRFLLFSPSSTAVRETVCGILENLCQTDNKRKKLLELFTRYLEDLHSAGENASDFLNLFKTLIKPTEWKRYLVASGILDKLTELVVREVAFLNTLENKTSGFDLSQGFALHALADILKMFFEDDVVKSSFKSKFVACVLQCYLSLRRLIVQRTKLIDAAQDILLALLEQLTTGTEAEERSFMAICLDALKSYPVMDIRTPVFIYERLCNIIHKEEKEINDFFVIIEKDPQQEDFLQGRMPGNPYSCKETGLGPLMRDIKNKICTECELIALLEDDTGMELLVNNKIINLDLAVADVYKKIWCAKGEQPEPMKIVYRMRGLLGDATEDMVDDLETDKDKDVDEEHEYRQAAVIAEVGGMDVILKRLSYIRDLSRAQDLVFVMLKLLEYCVKVKVNRQYLGKPSVNALKIMLGTLNLALRLEKEKGSGSGGAMIAEKLLNIMGIVLHEASAQVDQYQLPDMPGEESQLELLLGHITSPYVRTNPNVLEAMMRLIPSLSFGSEQSMHTLIHHFLPYLDFNRFDEERSPDETLYLDCFCAIANGISNTVSGSKLKDLINESDILKQAMDYLNQHTPSKSFSASGILDANRWKELLARPALPYVLKMLTGLVTGHSSTQELVGTEENIALLHRLEQVSSEENVGSLAENLLEALRENPEAAKRVYAVRRQTREEKKKMALAMRQKQLEALGMLVTDKGQIKAKPSSVIKEMEELLEEKGLICCICREGYKFHPKKVLAVYTYTTRCVLDEFENKQRKTQGYTTVSHFNVIHVSCHSEAIRHARSRNEWESAALQNANTKCNGIMPIWGPKVSESAFAACLARHNGYLQECTGFREPTFHSTLHDLKLLLLRFAHEQSFSDEAGGGGRISNMYLFPYMASTALYVLNTTRLHLTEEKIITMFLETPQEKWRESSYEVDGPLFVTILSIFTLPLSSWKEKRSLFLQRLMVLAHARSLSATPSRKWPDENPPKDFACYKPVLVFFALVNQFHHIFKSNLQPPLGEWTQTMSSYLRHNDEAILKAVDKLLAFYEKELLPCETIEEYLDVIELLGEVNNPSNFLAECLKMVQDAEKK